ncbi:MAG: hypothetical protein IKH54_02830 [Bacilli bacterium]|nr:hypothetical protein [Bacilli bacterium]
MNIDLSLLHTHNIEEIDISNTYDIPKEYYANSDVLELKNIKVSGKISLASSEEDYDYEKDYAKCNISGKIVLEDSISLEPIDYDFQIEYDDFIEENCKKNENTLDIFMFLWENIVLEVPLQYTKVRDLNEYQGDGWRLVSEDELTNNNNPFKDLLDKFEKE